MNASISKPHFSTRPLTWLSVLALQINAVFADPGEKAFNVNCIACHQIENKAQPIVGPSLVEIASIYGKDEAGFIKWSNAPKKKRKDAIQMPSMAHVGDENLKAIHAWMLKATKGKKYVPVKKKRVDPYALSKEQASLPRVQRMFLKDTSPASIAITVNGQHSLCWDTVSCRMRYIWKGGFIDAYPYWYGNGSSLATTTGDIYYRAPMKQQSGIISAEYAETPKFKGYKMKAGLPIFSYTIGSMQISEAISGKEGAIIIQVSVKDAKGDIKYPLGDLKNTDLKHSAGKIVDGSLILTAQEAAQFELTFNPKK